MTTGLDIILMVIVILCGIYAGLLYLNKVIRDDHDRLDSDDDTESEIYKVKKYDE